TSTNFRIAPRWWRACSGGCKLGTIKIETGHTNVEHHQNGTSPRTDERAAHGPRPGPWPGPGPDYPGFICRADELRVLLVLGQDRPPDVRRSGGRAGTPAVLHCRTPGAPRRPADTPVLRDPRAVTERVCHGAQSAARRSGRD